MRAGVVLGAVLALSGSVFTAGQATAAGSCSTRTPSSTPGGVVVRVVCSGPTAFIDGYGNDSTDANREALLLRQFQVTVGPTCSGTSSRVDTGGYSLRMTCSSPTNFITAYGTTLSDAAAEARLLETSAPNRACTHTFVDRVSGGYEVDGHCTSPTIFFSGVGSTVTGAAVNARLAAGLG
ncbi:hypothetical protein ACFFQW_15030 [Umezawaea endophytica]|uniref:Secreted protein n=1 Tax=Umezawaea endophytica TaxID=1654476 RepID=A0A9X3ADC1_9PSEU|nr:hypothetical protein [Umezawaea endophytica]MCS7475516.1 hypothetical protein [Umezawaea endophytica]